MKNFPQIIIHAESIFSFDNDNIFEVKWFWITVLKNKNIFVCFWHII